MKFNNKYRVVHGGKQLRMHSISTAVTLSNSEKKIYASVGEENWKLISIKLLLIFKSRYNT